MIGSLSQKICNSFSPRFMAPQFFLIALFAFMAFILLLQREIKPPPPSSADAFVKGLKAVVKDIQASEKEYPPQKYLNTAGPKISVADLYFKQELKNCLIYSGLLALVYFVNVALFLDPYGYHLILLVAAAFIALRVALIKYRLQKNLFGTTYHEAKSLLKYISNNRDSTKPPGGGSRKAFPRERPSYSEKDFGIRAEEGFYE